MKNLKILAPAAIVAALMASCGNSTPKAQLNNDVDSLSYAIGLTQSQYVRQAIEQGQVVDTTYMSEFVKGINEGVNAGDDKKRSAYILGLQIGQQINNQLVKSINHEIYGDDSTKTISVKNLVAAFVAGITKKNAEMTEMTAQRIATTKMEALKAQAMAKQYGANKTAGEKFLANNKKKPGVVTLPSGLQYRVIKEGKGAIPTDTTLCTLQYEGRTIDGKVFESTYTNGQGPVSVRPAQFIPGWTQALTRMPAGSVWEVFIPQELAYKDRQSGPIKPYSTLIFKIELIKVGK